MMFRPLAAAAFLMGPLFRASGLKTAEGAAAAPDVPNVDASASGGSPRDLAFVHIPHNFGHTVEMVAAFGGGYQAQVKFRAALAIKREMMLDFRDDPIMPHLYQHNQSVWGALDEGLSARSRVNCSLYLTPPKHWPAHLAERYFRGKKPFGLLRDPYERLVTYFRGAVADFSGDRTVGNYSKYAKTCDVNGAVHEMLEEYKSVKDTNPYIHHCAFLPQAEYFEGRYGVQVAVDTRKFPRSMNQVFKEHGYHNMRIGVYDTLRATGCSEVWAGALGPSTRELVKELYARDFDLLCREFNYCNRDESTCVDGVHTMCPSNLTRA